MFIPNGFGQGKTSSYGKKITQRQKAFDPGHSWQIDDAYNHTYTNPQL
jgi:hypothetical protein